MVRAGRAGGAGAGVPPGHGRPLPLVMGAQKQLVSSGSHGAFLATGPAAPYRPQLPPSPPQHQRSLRPSLPRGGTPRAARSPSTRASGSAAPHSSPGSGVKSSRAGRDSLPGGGDSARGGGSDIFASPLPVVLTAAETSSARQLATSSAQWDISSEWERAWPAHATAAVAPSTREPELATVRRFFLSHRAFDDERAGLVRTAGARGGSVRALPKHFDVVLADTIPLEFVGDHLQVRYVDFLTDEPQEDGLAQPPHSLGIAVTVRFLPPLYSVSLSPGRQLRDWYRQGS